MRFSPVFFVAGLLHVFRRIRPVAAILLAWKQKSRFLCNCFSIRDSFLSPKSGNGSFLRLISCAFVLRSAIGGHATIPNRKKVAIWAAILFLGFRSGFGQRGSGARGIDCRTGKKAAPWGGPDRRHGIFRAALGGRFGRPVDRRGSVLRAPPPMLSLPLLDASSSLLSAVPFHTFVERVT